MSLPEHNSNNDLDEILNRKKIEENTQLGTKHRIKKINYIVLCIISIIILIIATLFFIAVRNVSNSKELSGPAKGIFVDSYSNAFFIPNTNNSGKLSYLGKVDYALEITDNALIKHRLIDKNGEVIVYLMSNQNDLNLSVGLEVELEGKVNKNKYNGVNIFEVNSVKLK